MDYAGSVSMCFFIFAINIVELNFVFLGIQFGEYDTNTKHCGSSSSILILILFVNFFYRFLSESELLISIVFV